MKAERILAIDPGTRLMGVAVIENGELLYYGVKTIRRPKSPREILSDAARMLQNLIDFYQPTILTIEKTFLIQKSATLLMILAEEIKNEAHREHLKVIEYEPAYVRKQLCQTGKATKRRTAAVVTIQFPELTALLQWRTQFEERYYSRIFDAVALGIVCYEEITRHDSADPTLHTHQ